MKTKNAALDLAAVLVARSATTVGALCAATRDAELQRHLEPVQADLRAAVGSLLDAGVTPPGQATGKAKPAQTNPLAELARVERSRAEALALLDALRAALPRAEALEQARGDVLDAPIGGSAGLVWGEDLVQLIARLELELYGPGSAVTGARE